MSKLSAPPRLDLRHYCSTLVPGAVESNLDDQRLITLLDFLAVNLPRIEGVDQVRRSLRPLPMVPCSDGEQRRGEEAYFGSIDRLVVGDEPAIVRSDVDTKRLRPLMQWLGVADRPRAADVLSHCAGLRRPPANHEAIATAVLKHLADVDSTILDATYSRLKSERWLPIRGKPGAARPVDVYAIFRQSIFSSQADFLGVSQPVQQYCSDVLRWLGVQSNPPSELVVKHLIRCADDGTPVKDDLWSFLNDAIDDPALDRLQNRKCIRIEGGRVRRPSAMLLGVEPVRPLPLSARRQLPSLAATLRAPRACAVRQRRRTPSTSSGKSRIDTAASPSRSSTSTCRSFRRAGRSSTSDFDAIPRRDPTLSELGAIECVLDSRNHLRLPSEVLFRDSSTVAGKFDPDAASRLIDRPENMALALETAGVRHLREAISVEIIERADVPGTSSLLDRIDDRRRVLVRALDPVVEDPSRALSAWLERVRIVPLEELVVVESLSFGGTVVRSTAFARHALWRRTSSEFLVVEFGSVERWPEVAHELTVALGVAPEHVPTTAGLLSIVLAATTNEEATAQLDAFGFFELAEAVDVLVDDRATSAPEDSDESESPEEVRPESSPAETGDGPTSDDPDRHEPEQCTQPRPGDTTDDESDPDEYASPIGRSPGRAGPDDRSRSRPTSRPVSRPQRKRDRLKSYVAPRTGTVSTGDDSESDDESLNRRRAVDQAASGQSARV